MHAKESGKTMDSSFSFEPTERMTRYRRRVNWALTHEQRLELFEQLQVSALELLASNPSSREAFNRRNRQVRRRSRVRQLEAQMREKRAEKSSEDVDD